MFVERFLRFARFRFDRLFQVLANSLAFRRLVLSFLFHVPGDSLALRRLVLGFATNGVLCILGKVAGFSRLLVGRRRHLLLLALQLVLQLFFRFLEFVCDAYVALAHRGLSTR